MAGKSTIEFSCTTCYVILTIEVRSMIEHTIVFDVSNNSYLVIDYQYPEVVLFKNKDPSIVTSFVTDWDVNPSNADEHFARLMKLSSIS